MAIQLSKDAKTIIDAAVASGRYASPEAVIEAGLALLAGREDALQRLRKEIREAIEEGGSLTDEEVAAGIEAELDQWEQQRSSASTRAAE